MKKLEIKGLKNIDGMEFHDIEGGFGENKKAMLVKEISEIHNQPLGEINRRINDNRKRFKDGVDIVDLVCTDFAMGLSHNGIYSQNALNASKNIYLLSERGYSKLLKILEDDKAWEQYEKLVNGYFNMRAEVPKMSKELQAIIMIDEKTVEIDNRVLILENTMTIDYSQQEEMRSLATKKVVAILGGKGTPAYKELNKKAFSSMWRDYKRIVDVNSYRNTAIKDLMFARQVIIDWKPNRELELMIKGCNSVR